MKIIFLASSLGAGGAERVATTMCNAWSDRGDDVTLISTFSGGGLPFYRLADAVELLSLADFAPGAKKNLGGYLARGRVLRRLVEQRRPDVVISFLPNVNVAAIFALRTLSVPMIICERSDPACYPAPFPLRAACRLAYRFADLLMVQTESVAAAATRHYPGVKRVAAVPNPLPPGLVNHVRRGHPGRRILLSLGRLSAEKQLEKLISAFAVQAGRFSEWDLHIYGDGPLKAALQKQIIVYGLLDRVMLKGMTTTPWEAMASADAFALTSQFEGFPNAMLEAMGVGLPCIAFDCRSGPRELSANGSDAILVPMNDEPALCAALTKVMGNETFRLSLGAQARESVISRFGLPSVLDRWDRLFAQVGASRRALPGQAGISLAESDVA